MVTVVAHEVLDKHGAESFALFTWNKRRVSLDEDAGS